MKTVIECSIAAYIIASVFTMIYLNEERRNQKELKEAWKANYWRLRRMLDHAGLMSINEGDNKPEK